MREAKQPLAFYRGPIAELAARINTDLPPNAPLHDLYNEQFILGNLITDANAAIAADIVDGARRNMPAITHPKGVLQHTDFITALSKWKAPDEWRVHASILTDFLKVAPGFIRQEFPEINDTHRLDPAKRRDMVVFASELVLSEWRTDRNDWNMSVRDRFHMHLVVKGMERALKILMDAKGYTGKRYLIILMETLERLQLSLLKPQPPLTPEGTELAGKMVGLNVEIVEQTEGKPGKRRKKYSRQPDPGPKK